MRHLRRPRTSRAVLAASLPVLLLTAGCGEEAAPAPEQQQQQDALSRVEVVGGAESPELQVETPVSVAETVTEVVEEGDDDGRVVEEGDLVAMDVLAVDGGTGEVLETTYETESRLVLQADPATTVPGLVAGVVGQTVGSRVLVGVSPEDFGASAPGATTAPGSDGSVLLLVDVLSASEVLPDVDGEEVPLPAGLPAVSEGEGGALTVAAPEGEPPAELRVETLVRGSGREVAAGDTVVVDYTGVLWSDGSVFDSSRGDDREPFSFALGGGQVIPAWDQGLAGVPVGSRVMVVAPPDQAYGDQDTGSIPPGSTLVFVVDVLAAESSTR
ncbi:FKBP-type peptidyl-prolyl cis-trans isomerase [uncultured Pseudokineococcus sp.]|uniref:FKBP-type peptidyl-prolyl cis-trans isomerase n=1 Tax=uncultured Pseudokineococcus sp. TaxID=1642928 RepID=UPI0026301B17|nr:FKBP-type peptidyl-prolyl cis-trans isomerase [uncultured Pseudokineococcus sp.]